MAAAHRGARRNSVQVLCTSTSRQPCKAFLYYLLEPNQTACTGHRSECWGSYNWNIRKRNLATASTFAEGPWWAFTLHRDVSECAFHSIFSLWSLLWTPPLFLIPYSYGLWQAKWGIRPSEYLQGKISKRQKTKCGCLQKYVSCNLEIQTFTCKLWLILGFLQSCCSTVSPFFLLWKLQAPHTRISLALPHCRPLTFGFGLNAKLSHPTNWAVGFFFRSRTRIVMS